MKSGFICFRGYSELGLLGFPKDGLLAHILDQGFCKTRVFLLGMGEGEEVFF